MKTKALELMRESQRRYHRQCQWVMEEGINVLHSYEETAPQSLSWWDDVGFILGDRRVMVWWIHPRQRYADEIDELSRAQVGERPTGPDIFQHSIPNTRPLGRSRKKIASYTTPPAIGETRRYYDRLGEIRNKLMQQGIEFTVGAHWRRERLPWATGVTLVAPLEVRNKAELKQVADLARRLLRQETTLQAEFPDYQYGRTEWLTEQQLIQPK